MKQIEACIRNIPNFPIPGIQFKDLTPLLGNPQAFEATIDKIVELARELQVEAVGAFDARGFWFAPCVAMKLGVGWFPIRKPGKLPAEVVTETYALEYGDGTLAMHKDAIVPGTRVLLIDDVLATGGTMRAGITLVEAVGGTVVGVITVIELVELPGREKLVPYNVQSLITY